MPRIRPSRVPPAVLAILAVVLGAACAERHEARGLVLKVDAPAGVMTVSHDAIPGFMDAMVMPLTAAHPPDLDELRPGDRIAFRLNVHQDRTLVDRVRILSGAPSADVLMAPGTGASISIGEMVPGFTLINQRGEPISLETLRGSVVAIGFVYTRCPLPDYCPRVITNLASLRNRFGDRLGRDLVLLTITFDPKHDTPDTLQAFAASYGADVDGWEFLTGEPGDIARVCSLFGVESWPEEGLITHTLQTVVIDRDGRLAAIVEGKEFSPRQLGDLVEGRLAGR
jgi:protein SCO1